MHDDAYCLKRYRDLRDELPEAFAEGPIAVLHDEDEISAAQEASRVERIRDGHPVTDLRVGVLAEDHFIGKIVRDAVRFPDGRLGLYNRVIATGGVVVLPVLPDRSIALIRIFRHAPRRWLLEAPQGMLAGEDNPEDEVRRELREEIEAEAFDVIALGNIYTSTAMTSECLQVFAARIGGTGAPELAEGIEEVRIIPHDRIDALILDGTICDGPTSTAILRARLKGLL